MNHSFDVEIAMKYGVNAAILLQNIYWWICKNKANNRHFYDGYYWTYNSRTAFVELFPYLSERQIKTALDKLIEDGVIITGDYNTDKWKRPIWYALTDKGWSYYKNVHNDDTEMSNRGVQNVHNDDTEMSNRGDKSASSYTDIITDINNNDVVVERAREEQDINPYGYNDGGDAVPVQDTVQKYAMDNLRYMSPTAMQELNSFLDDLGNDLVRRAIDIACENDVRTWKYTKSILNGYLDRGIKTVGEAKTADEEYRKSKKTNNKQQSTQRNRPQLDTKINSDLPPLGKGDVII